MQKNVNRKLGFFCSPVQIFLETFRERIDILRRLCHNRNSERAALRFGAGKDRIQMEKLEKFLLKLYGRGERIFENAFGKLKIAAMVLCVAGMAASLICSVCFGIHHVLTGLIVLVGGVVASWLIAMLLYAFAELCEDAETIAAYYRGDWYYEHHGDTEPFEDEWEDERRDDRDGEADFDDADAPEDTADVPETDLPELTEE
jgi:hypothetical protein